MICQGTFLLVFPCLTAITTRICSSTVVPFQAVSVTAYDSTLHEVSARVSV